MPYHCKRDHFTVTVSSGFISDWQWAVHAVVTYDAEGLVQSRRDIESEAQLELMIGIARESRRGRAPLPEARGARYPWPSSWPLPRFTSPMAEIASTVEAITEADRISPANSHPSSTATIGLT